MVIIIKITIIIITLFKSQVILAEHVCSTNQGDCELNKSNEIIKSNISSQIKCRFLRLVQGCQNKPATGAFHQLSRILRRLL